MSEASRLPTKATAGEVPGKRKALMGVPPSASHSSMAQGLAAFVHAAKDDLDAGRRAQAPDPAVFVLAFDVARLILVSASLSPVLLCGDESPGVGEPQPGPGLEPPAGTERRRERSEEELCDFGVTLNHSGASASLSVPGPSLAARGAP